MWWCITVLAPRRSQFFILVSLPMIAIATTGTGVIGENYSVLCNIDVDDDDLNTIVVNTITVKLEKSMVNSMNYGYNSVSISYTP